MARWDFITQQPNGGGELANHTSLQDRTITMRRNRPWSVSAKLDADDVRARRDAQGGLLPGHHELIVYRDGIPLDATFVLSSVSIEAATDETNLALAWLGLESTLQDALVYGQAAQHSGTGLPWAWINAYQSRTGGDRGIVQGAVIGTPPTRVRTITEDAELLASIISLAESGAGFDFAIDSARQYREWHPQRGSDTGLVLEYGVNVVAMTYDEDCGPGQLLSNARVFGQISEGVPHTASNTTTRATYGRREASLSYMDEAEEATVTTGQLQAYADASIAKHAAPIIVTSVTLDADHPSVVWGAWQLGDTITIRAQLGNYTTISAPYRIDEAEIALDENDNEDIRLVVNPA